MHQLHTLHALTTYALHTHIRRTYQDTAITHTSNTLFRSHYNNTLWRFSTASCAFPFMANFLSSAAFLLLLSRFVMPGSCMIQPPYCTAFPYVALSFISTVRRDDRMVADPCLWCLLLPPPPLPQGSRLFPLRRSVFLCPLTFVGLTNHLPL